MPKLRNIIIFLLVGLFFVLIYVFFVKSSDDDIPDLVSSTSNSVVTASARSFSGQIGTGDFLPLLLSVKSIKLNDAIFQDGAFDSLRDSSITLIPDGDEGRPNPFAPIGFENISAPLVSSPLTEINVDLSNDLELSDLDPEEVLDTTTIPKTTPASSSSTTPKKTSP